LSLFGMVGSQMLIEPDWDVIGPMDKLDSPCSFAQDVSSVDPLRTEAMLHAWPTDPRDELANADWAEPYLAAAPSSDSGASGGIGDVFHRFVRPSGRREFVHHSLDCRSWHERGASVSRNRNNLRRANFPAPP
jgi:hypothetical protein